MDITREKLVCAVCGWQWWKRLGGEDPKRCPNKECRSMRWRGKPKPDRTLAVEDWA